MQDAALGLVIDEIRHNRNFTIEALCEGIISPSTYSRFVNGKTFLSSESFMKLVFRLHMTFAMFLQDYQDFFKRKHHYAILIHAKSYDEPVQVQKLVTEYRESQGTKNWKVQDERFLLVATALLGQMTNHPERLAQLKVVKEHLQPLKRLTDNDFFALKLLLPYMEVADAETVIQRHIQSIKSLQAPDLAGNLYSVCGLMYVKNLEAGDMPKAASYYQIMDDIYLDQLDLGWKISQKLYQNIHLYFTGDQEKAADQLNKLSVFYSDLNLSHQARFIAETCRKLNIPHQEVEVNG